jgi:hypothetical protein
MTSQERHELKNNSLAETMSDLPGFWRRHGNKLLMVAAVIALVLAGYRYKKNQDIARDQETYAALTNAWAAVDQLRAQQFAAVVSPDNFVKVRDEMEQAANRSVEDVIINTDRKTNPARLANAWLARGELYWTLATLPPVTGAATQPAYAPRQSEADYLKLAATAFGTVVNDYADQVQPIATARLSLAAIAENQSDFSTAQKHYTAVLESDTSPAFAKAIAQQRIVKLDTIAKPLLLLPATQPSTQTTTQPSTQTTVPQIDKSK